MGLDGSGSHKKPHKEDTKYIKIRAFSFPQEKWLIVPPKLV